MSNRPIPHLHPSSSLNRPEGFMVSSAAANHPKASLDGGGLCGTITPPSLAGGLCEGNSPHVKFSPHFALDCLGFPFSGWSAMAFEPTIVADAKEAADDIAEALSHSGHEADFSIESLRQVERFCLETPIAGRPGRCQSIWERGCLESAAMSMRRSAASARGNGLATTAIQMRNSILPSISRTACACGRCRG